MINNVLFDGVIVSVFTIGRSILIKKQSSAVCSALTQDLQKHNLPGFLTIAITLTKPVKTKLSYYGI